MTKSTTTFFGTCQTIENIAIKLKKKKIKIAPSGRDGSHWSLRSSYFLPSFVYSGCNFEICRYECIVGKSLCHNITTELKRCQVSGPCSYLVVLVKSMTSPNLNLRLSRYENSIGNWNLFSSGTWPLYLGPKGVLNGRNRPANNEDTKHYFLDTEISMTIQAGLYAFSAI